MSAFVQQVPLWGVLVGTFLLVLASAETGFRIGHARRDRSSSDVAPFEAILAAAFGLVALLLAFTFGMAGSRFEARREAVIEEANAIGTTYLRADFLPEPERSRARDLLREYVDVRVEGVRTGHLEAAIERSERIHGELWAGVTAAGQRTESSLLLISLYVESLNRVIDMHAERKTQGLHTRIPPMIWIVLYGLTTLVMWLLGYRLALRGGNRTVAALVLALIVSVVLMLIMDLDRSTQGRIRVDQAAMVDLRSSMER